MQPSNGNYDPGVGASTSTPRRKISMDLNRIKNFPSTLSLRKPEEPASSPTEPSSGAFTRIRNFKQAQLRRERSTKELAPSYAAQRPTSASGSTTVTTRSNESSPETSIFRRGSRLLDAFKPAKKQTPTFEVVRKPPNRSGTLTQSSVARTSSRADADGHNRRLSGISFDLPESDAPRLSMSSSRQAFSGGARVASGGRPAYPPSTSATRRLSSAAQAALGISDSTAQPKTNTSSGSNTPSGSPQPDAQRQSFSLHSFRNVRSNTDVSRQDDGGNSRRHSMISAEEFATPREELSEPHFNTEPMPPLPSQTLEPALVAPYADLATDAGRARSVSPGLSSINSKPASMSAAKFRQAARQRSESGNIPTVESLQNGSATSRPVRSRTPSQELAMVESVLSQTSLRPNQPEPVVEEPATLAQPPLTTALPQPAATAKRRRGLFIVVEGLDRAGKSTQVERLAAHLNAKAIKFPERTTAIGVMINSYLAQTSDLDDQAIHLLFSANRWESVASIKAAINNGENIVCDRYAFSGIAYSVAKGLSYEWCRNPDAGLPLPDLTMFLDLDAETAAARGGYGEERYEKLDFQAKVRDAFRRVSHDVKAHGGRWATIDASKTLEQVTEEIQNTVYRATSSIDRAGRGPLGRLFVSQRPANERDPSSKEILPPPTSSVFPVARPAGPSLSYSEQLAAVRAAASGNPGFFGGPTPVADPGLSGQQRQAEGPPAMSAADRKALHRRSMSAALDERPSSRASGVIASALSSLTGRSRRSSEQIRPTGDELSAANGAVDPSAEPALTSIMSDRRRSVDGARVNGYVPAAELRTRPSLSNISTKPSQSSQTSASAVSPAPRVSFNLARGPNETGADSANAAPPSGGANGASLSAQQLAMMNAQQSQAEMQEQYMRNYMAMMANPMLAQQAHYQMMLQRQQQYYGRAASVPPGDANGVYANSSANGSANGGPPAAAFMQPGQVDAGYHSAAQEHLRRERRLSRQRTLSSGSLAEPSSSLQAQHQQQQQKQPMLSMMMAAPPQNTSTAPNSPSLQAQHIYHPQQQQMMYGGFPPNAMAYPMQYGGQTAYGQRPFYRNAAHSETVLPTIYSGPGAGAPAPASRKSSATNLRTQRSVDRGLRKPEPPA